MIDSQVLVSHFPHEILNSLILLFLFYVLVKYIWPTLSFIHHYIRLSDKHLPCHPIWGHLRLLIPNFPSFTYNIEETSAKFYDLVLESQETHSDIHVIWFGWYPMVLVSGHQAVEAVINKVNLSKPWFYKFLGLQDGLVVSHPDKWRVRRKILEPLFATKKQRKYLHYMDEEMSKLIDDLKSQGNKPVNINNLLPVRVFNIINKASWQMKDSDFPEIKSKAIETIDFISNALMRRMMDLTLWLDITARFTQIYKKYHEGIKVRDELTYKYLVLARERKTLNPVTEKSDYDLIDTMAAANVDIEGTAEELVTFIGAGHETTLNAIQWTLFTIANFPEIQERLYQEIITVFPEGTPVTDLDKINECEYLDRCIKESFRWNSPVPVFFRKLDEDTIVRGKKLLKGTFVTVSIIGTHLDPEVYENPTKYDPDRWLPENAGKIPKAAFIPFAYGPRNCIGYRYAINEKKVALIHILRNFQVKSLLKPEEVGRRIDVSTKPTRPLEFIFTSRNQINNN